MSKSKYRVVIVHGSYGTPSENWFPWLANELRLHGHDISLPTFPTPVGQSLDSWKATFGEKVGKVTSNMVLVGHSLGVGFILNLIEEASEPVVGTFLVSGFTGNLGLPEFDLVNETFVCRRFDWERIRRNSGKGHVYNSDNDPYVPLAKGQEIAAQLGVRLTVVANGGHINEAAGFKTFPLLLEDMSAIIT